MVQLLVIRERIKSFVSRYENYCKPFSKFVLTLITLIIINTKLGYTEKLTNVAVMLIISLMASFMPLGFIVVIDILMILLHLYSLSLESVIVVGVLLILMYLLYFRFSPKDTLLLIFTPLSYVFHIPYAIPLAAGLVSSPSSVISVGCGTVVYYILSFISKNETVLATSSTENILLKLRFLIDELLYNKEMLMMVIAFSVTIICVNIIRRLSVDHAWTIAIVTGSLMNIFIILVGDLKYNTYISIFGLLFGSIVAVAVVAVIKFFVFNVDYSRTEMVQFEDDEYYYYVKAVPKNAVSGTDKKVKKIKGQSKAEEHRRRSSRSGGTSEGDVQEYRVRRAATKPSADAGERTVSKKAGTRRIILPDETIEDGKIVKSTSSAARTDRNGMTGIERAAAAKARAEREERNQNNK